MMLRYKLGKGLNYLTGLNQCNLIAALISHGNCLPEPQLEDKPTQALFPLYRVSAVMPV